MNTRERIRKIMRMYNHQPQPMYKDKAGIIHGACMRADCQLHVEADVNNSVQAEDRMLNGPIIKFYVPGGMDFKTTPFPCKQVKA